MELTRLIGARMELMSLVGLLLLCPGGWGGQSEWNFEDFEDNIAEESRSQMVSVKFNDFLKHDVDDELSSLFLENSQHEPVSPAKLVAPVGIGGGENGTKFDLEFLREGKVVVEGDRADFLDYESSDYDIYSYEDLPESRASKDDKLPRAEMLRDRRPAPFRRPLRRRHYWNRFPPSGGGVRGKYPPPRRPEFQKGPRRKEHHSPPHVNSKKLNSDRMDDSVNSESINPKPVVDKSSGCDFYTDTLCLDVADYPLKEILSLLGTNRRVSDDMIADVMEQSADDLIDGVSSNQENTYTFSHYFGNRREDSTHTRRDFAQEGGFLCPSEIKYAKPKRGKTAQGDWKDIVNVNDYSQTLRMEKCLQPGGSCSYVSHHYKSQCSQVYNYHRLLSWNKERGLHMDIYKVPTCCSCHIMGYSYVYPPLNKGDSRPSSLSSSPASSTFPSSSFTKFSSPSFSSASSSSPSFSSSSLSLPSSSPPFSPSSPPFSPSASFTTQSKPPQRFAGSNPVDNLILDFNPQQELEQFMATIGNDIKDFNSFGKTKLSKRGSTQVGMSDIQRASVPGGSTGGISPPMGGTDLRLSPHISQRSRTSAKGLANQTPADQPVSTNQQGGGRNKYPIRRGGGFSPEGEPNVLGTDPVNKYESIPLDSDAESKGIVNYGYHPIIDFFDTEAS